MLHHYCMSLQANLFTNIFTPYKCWMMICHIPPTTTSSPNRPRADIQNPGHKAAVVDSAAAVARGEAMAPPSRSRRRALSSN